MPTVTPDELREVEAAFQAAQEVYLEKQTARANAVRQALADGMTHAQVAEVLGVSRGRVSQFVVKT